MNEDKELLLVELKEALVEECSNMLKENEVEITEDILREIWAFYNWKINKSAVSIENTFDFINEWLNKDKAIYFLNPKLIRKQSGFIGKYNDGIKENELVSIMALNRNTLGEYSDRNIIKCTKETDKKEFLKLFAANNLYLYPQINVSKKELFLNENHEYDIYWKHVEKNAIDLCKKNNGDFKSSLKDLKNKIRKMCEVYEDCAHDKEDLFSFKVGIYEEIDIEKFHHESYDTDVFNEVNPSFMMKINKKSYVRNKKMIKNSSFSDSRAGIMLLNDEDNLISFLCKDILSSFDLNNGKLVEDFPMWKFILTTRGMALNENIYDYLVNLFNKETLSNEAKIKKALIWKILDISNNMFFNVYENIELFPTDKVMSIFESLDTLELDKETKEVKSAINSIKNFKDLGMKKQRYFFHKNIDEFFKDLNIGILQRRIKGKIIAEINMVFGNENAEIKISINSNSYTMIESNLPVDEDVMWKTLNQLVEEKTLHAMRVLKKEQVNEKKIINDYSSLKGDGLNTEWFKRMLHENQLLSEMQKMKKENIVKSKNKI